MTVYEVFYTYADYEPQRVAAFLSEEQAQRYIRQAAKKAGLTTSEYIRRAITQGAES